MQRCAMAGLTLAVIVMGAACSGDTRGHACEGGEVRACTCDDGSSGLQNCALDGSQWRACYCPDRDAGAPDVDASSPSDPDAGESARLDAGHDAGATAGPDAGPPPACDLYARECTPVATPPADGHCPSAESCRRSHLASDPSNVSTGPPECTPWGSITEHSATRCRDDTDCRCGLFCRTTGECVRYCDPAGEPCPDYVWPGGSSYPQHCVEDALSVFYCSDA